jgi:hypothetical protein
VRRQREAATALWIPRYTIELKRCHASLATALQKGTGEVGLAINERDAENGIGGNV